MQNGGGRVIPDLHACLVWSFSERFSSQGRKPLLEDKTKGGCPWPINIRVKNESHLSCASIQRELSRSLSVSVLAE